MITNFARTIRKVIKVDYCCCMVRCLNNKMSGGSNPLNGSLPPDWNRLPSMNSYPQQNPCYTINPFPTAEAYRRPANAFGYNANQHNAYANPQQQYFLPATHMWNNQMQYQQNSLYQQQNPMNSPYAMPQQIMTPSIMQAQPNFTDFMAIAHSQQIQSPPYPSLCDRLANIENQIAYNYGSQNCNDFGGALNSFVQDMMCVSPPLPTIPNLPILPPPPVTTLYQSNLLKDLNLLYKSIPETIPEINEPVEAFDLRNFLTSSEKDLLNFDDTANKLAVLETFNLSEEQLAPRPDDEADAQHKCPSPPRLYRQWQTIRPPSDSDRSFHFSIMNYNVLAQDLLEMHPELYYRNEEAALDWSIRWKNLKEEIHRFNCDIICLQEVQETHKDLFDEHFRSLGYGSLYKKRTGTKTDGCSIYYRETMFRLLEFITVEYNQPKVSILDRDNIAIIAKLLAKGNEQEIIIANTHLLFNPRRQDIRLVQTQLLLTEIDRMAFKNCVDRNLCEYCPVIMLGDFNSTPSSSVIEFVKTGYLNYENLNKRTLMTENMVPPNGKVLIPPFLQITDCCQHNDIDVVRDTKLSREEQIVKLPLYHSEFKKQQPLLREDVDYAKHFATGTLRHKLRFQSVYNHGTFDNPEGTTNQGQWITTDYIFYNRSSGMRGKDWKLNLIARYILPRSYELRDVAIPNHQLGSDHLSLVAKFSLKTPRK